MGRLGGFSYREVTRRLTRAGFILHKTSAGSHEIWKNLVTRRMCVVPNHRGDMPEGTLRSILKQAALAVDDFLAD